MRRAYPADGTVTEDIEDVMLRVSNDIARTRRGGSFAYEWFTTRSAHRGDITYALTTGVPGQPESEPF